MAGRWVRRESILFNANVIRCLRSRVRRTLKGARLRPNAMIRLHVRHFHRGDLGCDVGGMRYLQACAGAMAAMIEGTQPRKPHCALPDPGP